MNIEVLENLNNKDIENLKIVWEDSVRSTHTFLTEENINSLKPCVAEGLLYVENVSCIRNSNNDIVAFIGVHNQKVEMLFIKSSYRGKGLGKKLMKHAIDVLCVKHVDVNEQNPQAVGFYEYMKFKTFKRSEFDDQGNNFPILHMILENK